MKKGDTGAQGPKGDTGAQGPKGDNANNDELQKQLDKLKEKSEENKYFMKDLIDTLYI